MELICPSCEARYQLPEGSIGEKGRQVSCMNCGHGWHAYPPLVLGMGQRSRASADPMGIPFGGAGAAIAGTAGLADTPKTPETSRLGPQDEVATDGGMAEPGRAQRSEQLAEIREMLAEVQAEDAPASQPFADADDIAPRAATADDTASAAPTPLHNEEHHEVPGSHDSDEDEIDPLRARLNQHGGDRQKPKPVDVKKMRKRHDRRERSHERSKKAGSGAFMTGFLLIAIVAAVMIALYVLHPLIIQRIPGTEPALTEYVATVDGLRVSVAETFDKAKSWVVEHTDKG